MNYAGLIFHLCQFKFCDVESNLFSVAVRLVAETVIKTENRLAALTFKSLMFQRVN